MADFTTWTDGALQAQRENDANTWASDYQSYLNCLTRAKSTGEDCSGWTTTLNNLNAEMAAIDAEIARRAGGGTTGGTTPAAGGGTTTAGTTTVNVSVPPPDFTVLSTPINHIGSVLAASLAFMQDPTERGLAGLVQTFQAWALFDVRTREAAPADIGPLLRELVSFLTDPTKPGLAGLVKQLSEFFSWNRDDFNQGLAGLWSQMASRNQWDYDPTHQGIAGLVQTIQAYALHDTNVAAPSTARISEDIHILVGALLDPEAGVGSKIVTELQNLASAFAPLSEPQSPETALQRILRQWSNAFQGAVDTAGYADEIIATGPPLVGRLAAGVIGGKEMGAASGLFNLLHGLLEQLAKSISWAAHPILETLEQPAVTFAREIVNQLQASLGKESPALIENVNARAIDLFQIQLGLGTRAHLIALSGEALPYLKHIGLPQLSAFLVDMANFKDVAKAATGSMIQSSITTPSTHAAHVTFRSTRPAYALLDDMVARRIIDEPTFARELGFQGYTPEWIEQLQTAAWKDPSLRELATALEDVSVDAAWLRTKIEGAGYEDADIDHLLTGILQRATKSARAKLVAGAASAFSAGLIDAAELEAQFDAAGLSESSRTIERQTASLAAKTDLQRELISAYTDEVMAGAITLDDYPVLLASAGLDPAHINVRVQLARAKLNQRHLDAVASAAKSETTKRQAELVPRYIALYRRGLLSAGQLAAALLSAGLMQSLVDSVVSLEEISRTATDQERAGRTLAQFQARVQAENVRALRALVEAGEITLGQFEGGILQAGVPNAIAASMATEERVKLAKKGRVKTSAPQAGKTSQAVDEYIALLKEEYRGGLIDEQALLAGLQDAGVDPETAGVMVDREIVRQMTKTAGKKQRASAAA